MRAERIYGGALIAGAAAMLVTMGFHPTGRALLDDFDRVVPVLVGTHLLGMLAASLSFFGGVGLTRRLASQRELATGALVGYGLSSLAGVLAAVMSGLLAPAIAARMVGAVGAEREALSFLFWYNGSLNQGFAVVAVLAGSLAILLWSVAVLRGGELSRGAGVLGCLVGVVTLAAMAAGLQLDVHGFGAVVLGQAAWSVTVGTQLIRASAPRTTPAPRR